MIRSTRDDVPLGSTVVGSYTLSRTASEGRGELADERWWLAGPSPNTEGGAVRIAMVGQKGIPASYGGVEKAVEEVAARLVARGHDVTVYNRWQPGPKPREHRGIRLRYVPAPGSKHLQNLAQSALGTALATASRHDVVHYHALGPCLASPLARLRPKARVVVTIQGRDDQRAKWGKGAQAVLATAAWMAARIPHGGIAVSRQLQREFGEEFGTDVTYIPNGVAAVPEAPVPDPDPLETFGLEPGRYLINVGRLVPEKAIDQLLAAYPDVPGDVKLVIVGGSSHTDDYVDRLQRLAAADDRIVLTGPVYGAGTDRLFRNALGYVMPSLLEGLPLALLEAISYGLPVAVSDIEPHVEVVGADSAAGHRIFGAGDAASMVAALTELVEHPERERQAAQQLQARVLHEFSWERITDRTEALYRELLGTAEPEVIDLTEAETPVMIDLVDTEASAAQHATIDLRSDPALESAGAGRDAGV